VNNGRNNYIKIPDQEKVSSQTSNGHRCHFS